MIDSAEALHVLAAMRVDRDRIIRLERSIDSALQRLVPAEQLSATRSVLIGHALSLSATFAPLDVIQQLPVAGNDRLAAQQAWQRGDTREAARRIQSAVAFRGALPPADRSLDAVSMEAELMRASNDPAGAARWLDESLGALAWNAPDAVIQPYRTAIIPRVAVQRMELARAVRDSSTERRFARAMTALWLHAEPDAKRLLKEYRTSP